MFFSLISPCHISVITSLHLQSHLSLWHMMRLQPTHSDTSLPIRLVSGFGDREKVKEWLRAVAEVESRPFRYTDHGLSPIRH